VKKDNNNNSNTERVDHVQGEDWSAVPPFVAHVIHVKPNQMSGQNGKRVT
jgi:hypothetical protein